MGCCGGIGSICKESPSKVLEIGVDGVGDDVLDDLLIGAEVWSG